MLSPPYRVGPWPGLTPSGALVLLTCAVLVALGQLILGEPARPMDLPLVATSALLPMVIATRMVYAPGVASAVCGAYVMPRALLSLADPSRPLPPLLLVAALAFDVALWLRASDVAWRPRGRRRVRTPRSIGRARAFCAGAVFGMTFGLIEPSYRVFVGADPTIWSGLSVIVAAALGAVGCAVVALLSVRGRAS